MLFTLLHILISGVLVPNPPKHQVIRTVQESFVNHPKPSEGLKFPFVPFVLVLNAVSFLPRWILTPTETVWTLEMFPNPEIYKNQRLKYIHIYRNAYCVQISCTNDLIFISFSCVWCKRERAPPHHPPRSSPSKAVQPFVWLTDLTFLSNCFA